MGNPQAYGVIHYLYDSLFDNPSFPVKKLHHRTLSHLFSRVDDIKGHTKNMHAVIKPQIKSILRCPESILSCQHLQNIQRPKKNHLEAQMNAENNNLS
jgi:hypothetical protein